MEIKKVSEDNYEIPKEGMMNVPVKVYASEKILEDIKLDKTLEQAKNVARLPGILNYSIALADAHQGYGFPIGGVAAFDLNSGVISPGGVGYDINCLKGNSKILSEWGYYKEIREFEDENKESLIILDKNNKKLISSNISLFMKKSSEKIIKIKTKSGTEIFATKDHPLYTKDGMKEIKTIKNGEEVLLYPFDGVKYEKPQKILLIKDGDIDKLNRSFTSKLQIKNKLKSLGLLPLYSDSPKIPYLIKLMGFIFGDGSLSFGKNEQIGFYGNKEDLELIKDDLNKIGFSSNLFSRERKHKLKTEYKEYQFSRIEHSLHCHSSSLALLLNFLGVPKGNKAKQEYEIPKWIMSSPLWYKRLFLASLFGAELSSPKTITNHRFNLYVPVYSINKDNILHGVNFVNQISALLEEFGVRSVLVKNRVDELNGKKFNRIRLMIYSDSENLINLYSKINYEYNIKKRKLANVAIVWLKQKERILEFREQILCKAREMKERGFTKSQIINDLSGEYSNKYFIDKAIYQSNYARTGTRIAYAFISFNEFLEKKSYGEGFVWDEIENIEEIEFNDMVYDLTINNNNHNFIANSFVVSNCSVRLLRTNLTKKDVLKKQNEILEALDRKIPSGVGRGSKFQITKDEFKKIITGGAQYLIKKGYGNKEDYLHTEEEGFMKDADSSKVSEKAISRGIGQLGTIGSGNHFLEVLFVDEIFDEKTAKAFSLKKDQAVILIHCGSRGFGHQIASDYIKKMEQEYGTKNLPDRELACAPIKSKLGTDYYGAMCCAVNFAFANKQLITHWIREEIKYLFPNSNVEVVYDVCHNIAKFEKYLVNGKIKEVCVHRKGATRSFGPGREEIPKAYRKVGQPVLIPGTMGTASYVLVGTKKSEELTWGSSVHGAGRVMSRSRAIREIKGEETKKKLHEKKIEIKSRSFKAIAEESPEVYKDIEEVVNVVHNLGISKKVARLKPLVVIIG